MSPEPFSFLNGLLDLLCSGAFVSRRRELCAVVGQDRMDLVRNRFDQAPQEIPSDLAGCLFMQLDEGKF